MNEKKIDIIGKIIVIALIAIFVAWGIYLMLQKNTTPAVRSTGNISGNPMRAMTGSGGGARGGAGASGAGAPAENRITISAKTVQPETIQKTVLVNGNVSTRSEVNAYPDTSGKLTQLLKGLGDTIRQGEVLAYIDPSRPGQSYTASPVLAPVGGTITSMQVHVGDTVSANSIIAVIGSLEDLEITTYISEKYSAHLKKGLDAYISVSSAPDEQFLAKVDRINPVVNKTSRTVEVGLRLERVDARIKPGMFASLRVVIMQADKTVVIPKTALKTYNADTVVYVVNAEQRAERRTIKMGMSNDLEVQVLEGLKMGEVVITGGSVTEGSLVRIAGELAHVGTDHAFDAELARAGAACGERGERS